MSFTPYKIKKRSRHDHYSSSKYSDINSDFYRMASLCSICGYPYGEHFGGGKRCPKDNEVDYGIKKEFYPIEMNKNIKVL